MGQCYSCECQYVQSIESKLETHMQIHQDKLDATHKVLLLGSGSSGKSTIFKQLQRIYGNGLRQKQIKKARDAIRQNLLDGIIKLGKQSLKIARCIRNSMDIGADEEIVAAAMEICTNACEHLFDDNNMIEETMIAIGNAIGTLWDLELFQLTFSKRGAGQLMYSFPDNMEIFFQRVELIFVHEWEPTTEDVLQARAMTTGTESTLFAINGKLFDVIDVGGQRNERRKWIHTFDDVDTVLFVAALDHYRLSLVEEEKKNAMHESLELFNSTVNGKWFKRSTFVLFLNRADLHRRAIKEENTMALCFNNEWDPSKEQKDSEYAMVDYVKIHDDEEKDAELLERAINASICYIKEQYLQQREDLNKEVFVHVCNALDRKNVEEIYWDVQTHVIDHSLRATGLNVF